MPSVDHDALSTVDAYHRAWTSSDVDRTLTYVSDDIRCFAPDENITTKGTTTTLASELFTVQEGQIVEIRLAFDRLGYMPKNLQPA